MKSDNQADVKSIVCGAATGAANGLFGGGGGMIAVPLLRAQGLEEAGARYGDRRDSARFAAFVSVVCVPRIF